MRLLHEVSSRKYVLFIVVNKGKNDDIIQTLYKASFQTTNNLAF
jgi:hypothetical protein